MRLAAKWGSDGCCMPMWFGRREMGQLCQTEFSISRQNQLLHTHTCRVETSLSRDEGSSRVTPETAHLSIPTL